MRGRFNLSISSSLSLWAYFAAKSIGHYAFMVVIIWYYVLVSLIATPVYLLHVVLFSLLNLLSGGRVPIEITNAKHQNWFLCLIEYNVVGEPQSRALKAIANLEDYQAGKRAEVPKRRTTSYRVEPFLLSKFVGLPFSYMSHINYWVIALGRGFPKGSREMRHLVLGYIMTEF